MSISPMALELHRAHVARIKKWERLAVPEPKPKPEPEPKHELKLHPIWKSIAFGMVVPDRCWSPPPSVEALGLVKPTKPPHINDIQRAVCAHFDINKETLLLDRRFNSIVFPRQIAMYLCKTLTRSSYPEIGRRFGGRDHTTVLHAVHSIERRRQNPDVNSAIVNIKGLLHVAVD